MKNLINSLTAAICFACSSQWFPLLAAPLRFLGKENRLLLVSYPEVSLSEAENAIVAKLIAEGTVRAKRIKRSLSRYHSYI
jgi:hypothetical protein